MTTRKLPIRTKMIELNDDWTGWSFTARVNPPLSVLEDLSSSEFGKIIASLDSILIDWNFVDEEGESLGKPSIETIKKLPSDLAIAMSRAINTAIVELSGN